MKPRTPITVAEQAIFDGVSYSEYCVWCRSNDFMPVNNAKYISLKK